MKLYSVTLTNRQDETKPQLEFKYGKDIAPSLVSCLNANDAYKLLRFAFGNETDCDVNGVVSFRIDGQDYKITVTHNDKGTARKNLKKVTDDSTETVAREKSVYAYLNDLLDCNPYSVISGGFVGADGFKKFVKTGSVDVFDDVKSLRDLIKESDALRQKSEEMAADASQKIRRLAEEKLPSVTKDTISDLNDVIKEKRKDLAALSAALDEDKRTNANNAVTAKVLEDKKLCDEQYDALIKRQNDIELLKQKLKAYEDTRDVLPQAKLVKQLSQEIKQATEERAQAQELYEWQQKEFESISQQLAQKQEQSDKLIALKSRLQVAAEEQSRAQNLEKSNKELNASLNQLSEQADKLTTKKVDLKNRLENIEQSINDIRDNIKEFKVPDFTIGDIVENVRTDAKIAEISNEVDRLQTEIASKESDISDKEMTISGQTRRLNSLLSLDSTVAPLKAKDSIIKTIDSKVDKLLLINDSLKQKKTNYVRALEDFAFRQLKTEQSAETLNTMLNRKEFEKEQEFKRQVMLAQARNDSMVEALPAQLTDPEIEKLKTDIADRTLNKYDIIESSARLKGALEEIERHMAINNAEIESLRKEKANINRKYLELVSQNRNEGTQPYLKSLETNNSTKYLMDIQEQVVKNDTELRTYKRDVEKLQGRLNEMLGRLKYLKENSSSATADNLEFLTSTNDQIKNELSDIGDRLSICYAEHKTASDQLDQLNYTDFRMRELLLETMQKIKANEREIAAIKQKTVDIAGGDLTEKSVETESELEEITGERNTLAAYKAELEQKVFDGKVRIMQLDWQIKEKNADISSQLEIIKDSLAKNNQTKDALSLAEGMEETDAAEFKTAINEFETQKSQLAHKIAMYEQVLSVLPPLKKQIPQETIAKTQAEVDKLNLEVLDLQDKLDFAMTVFINTSSAKINLAQATDEYDNINSIKPFVEQSKISRIVLTDKISSIIRQAGGYLSDMTDGKYTLAYAEDDMIIGDSDNNLVQLSQMENTARLMLYTALLLAQPSVNGQKAEWLLIDDRIICNHEQYYKALTKLNCYLPVDA